VKLGYNNNGKNRRYHDDEYLIHGGISADDYRLLAAFEGQGERVVALSVPGLTGSTTVPDGFMTTALGATEQKKLENTVCDVMLMLVLTIASFFATPTVLPKAQAFSAEPKKDSSMFAANLVTRML
jgi:hypothetical protein